MSKRKTIAVRCKGSRLMTLDQLEAFQGELKDTTPEAMDKLKASILKHGYTVPILVWRKKIMDGHERRLALLDLREQGYTIPKLPVADIRAKSKKQAAEIVLQINSRYARITDSGLAAYLDTFALDKDILAEIDLADIDLDSFTSANADDPPEDPGAQLDKAAELQEKWKVKRGQIWQVGAHRIMCGDSTSETDVERLMDGEKAGVCFSSPPYLQQRDYTDASDCEDWRGLMSGSFGALRMEEDGQVLINLGLVFRDREYVPYWRELEMDMLRTGWLRYGWYVWSKGQAGRKDGARLPTEHEWVFHFCRKPREPLKPEPCVSAGERHVLLVTHSTRRGPQKVRGQVSIVNEFKVRGSVCSVHRSPGAGIEHPAAFPPAFPCYFIEHWGGIVTDPFLGSGTTAVACEQLGRICYGMEIEPKYVAVALQRLTDMGLEAKQIKKMG